MSGWQLGLYSLGLLLAGVGLGITLVVVYARHVYRQKVGQLVAAAENETLASLHVEPPPPRRGGAS